MIRIPNIVSAHPKTGIKSIPELIAYPRGQSGQARLRLSGVGQSPHLTGAWFLQLTGLKMTHVPFFGAGPALPAALAGDIQILFDNLYPRLPQVLDGTLAGLCVTTTERSESAPRICRPCARARLSSPTSTCRPGSRCSCRRPRLAALVEALNEQIKAMLERDDIKKQIVGMGARADYSTPQQFSAFVDAETGEVRRHHPEEGLQMEVTATAAAARDLLIF